MINLWAFDRNRDRMKLENLIEWFMAFLWATVELSCIFENVLFIAIHFMDFHILVSCCDFKEVIGWEEITFNKNFAPHWMLKFLENAYQKLTKINFKKLLEGIEPK